MREVDLLRLDARQRALWETGLAKPPLFSDPASGIAMGTCALGALGGAFVMGIAFVVLHRGSGYLDPDLLARAVVSSAGLVVLASSVRAARWTRLLERAPWRCGRFLFPWGYAEVTPTQVRFVPGDELTVDVDIGLPRITGASVIAVRVSTASGWSATLDTIGSELDVPRDAIDALPRTTLDHAEGYRTSARVIPASDPAPRWSPRLIGALATIAISAVVGAALPPVVLSCLAMREAERTTVTARRLEAWASVTRDYPLPWVTWRAAVVRTEAVEAARTRIRSDVRPPYREALELLLVDDSPDVFDLHDTCRGPQGAVARLNHFAHLRANGRLVEDLEPVFGGVNPHFTDLFALGRPTFHTPDAPGHFDTSCEWEPIGLTDTSPTRASFRLRAVWTLLVHDHVEVQRGVEIEPDVIAEAIGCAGDDTLDAPATAAIELVRGVIHTEVFTAGVSGEESSTRFAHHEALEPCVRRIAERLEAHDLP